MQGDLEVTYPNVKSPMFSAILCLFEALMELDDDETTALSKCDGNLDTQLLELVSLRACSHLTFALAMISFYVNQYLPSLGSNSSIECNGS